MNSQELSALAGNALHEKALSQSESLSKFCAFWPVIAGVLETVKVITPQRVDRVIDQILGVGRDICSSDGNDNSEAIQKFCSFWPVVRTPLQLVKFITPKKVDKVIDEFTAVADSLCD